MDLNKDALTALFEEYVIENHRNDLMDVMKLVDVEKHYGVVINFMLLFEKRVELGHGLLSNASVLLPLLDKNLVCAQRTILASISDDKKEACIVKTNVHVRMTGLPACPELHRTSFPQNRDVGSLLRVSGTVTRITSPKMLEYRREYLCTKCKQIFPVQAEYELYYTLKPPASCVNPKGCTGTNLSPVTLVDQLNYKDYQEIKIQEQVSKLGIGTVPQSMWATLEDDLVDSCKPGDDVVICGTVMRRWRPVAVGNRHDIELYLRVSHLSVSNDDRTSVLITNETIAQFEKFWRDNASNTLLARDLIVASICPQAYGLYLVKLAIAIILAGGVGKQEFGGCRIRGEPHLLLVGDPGTGKSHIIRFASRICSRAVHTTGIGSTSAGLTVTAVHEHGEWQLEAGALVLADGGICCIDEFNSMREHDRTTIHEAMEQQTISVAKAGVVCKLNTRCSIIAATNPKGHYDPNIPLSVNIAVASPLLSRFDLVLVLLDSKNFQWDKTMSEFILRGKKAFKTDGATSLWSSEKLLEYFCVVKRLNPKLTDDANTVVCTYYQFRRKADSRNVARTTVRLLESLIRLSQGHARLLFRENVLVQDAIVAISLIECSMLETALMAEVDTLHATFPTNPLVEYRKQAKTILGKLELPDILRKELQTCDDITSNPLSQHLRPQNRQNENESDVAGVVRDTNEKLANILTDIRKKKDRTIFDSLMRERQSRPSTSKWKKTADKQRRRSTSSEENTKSEEERETRSDVGDESVGRFNERANATNRSALLNFSSDSDSDVANAKIPLRMLKRTKSKTLEDGASKTMTLQLNQRESAGELRENDSRKTSRPSRPAAKKKKISPCRFGNSFLSDVSVGTGANGHPSYETAQVDGISSRNDTLSPPEVLIDDDALSPDAADVPLFGDFVAAKQKTSEEWSNSTRSTFSTSFREKLQQFAHSSRIVDAVPTSDKPIVNQSVQTPESRLTIANHVAESCQNGTVLTTRNVDQGGENVAARSSATGRREEAARTDRVFSIYSVANDDDDLSILDDL